jgi:hypothetical protein
MISVMAESFLQIVCRPVAGLRFYLDLMAGSAFTAFVNIDPISHDFNTTARTTRYPRWLGQKSPPIPGQIQCCFPRQKAM